ASASGRTSAKPRGDTEWRRAIYAGRRRGYGFDSEPARFIDQVAQWLSREKAAAIVGKDLVAALVEIGAVARGMRRDQDARQGPQRMFGGQRLLLEHIEPGAGDFARLQGCREIVEAGRHAAADIDKEGGALHTPKPHSVHITLGLGRVRHGQDDKICPRQLLVERR